MNAHQVLVSARSLISKDARPADGAEPKFPLKGRIKGNIFTTPYGQETLKLSNASCFCSIGAIIGAIGCDADTTTGRLAPVRCDGWVPERSHLMADYGDPNLVTATASQRRVFSTAYEYLNTACKRVSGGTDIMELNDAEWDCLPVVLLAFDLAIKNAKRRHINGGK